MLKYQEHIVSKNNEARVALKRLDELDGFASRTLFVVDENNKLVGSLTDGDIRRGLLNGNEISYSVELFMNKQYKFLKEAGDNIKLIKEYRKSFIQLVPLLDENHHIRQIVDLKEIKTLLPVSVLIMAGGKGERLKPFTDSVPKPMLKVGDKPILEHNIDRLISFGITDFFISVSYLKEHIMDYFRDGSSRGINIKYIEEDTPLGTLGALSLIDKIDYEDILVMNSDLLTNINFEDFFNFYRQENVGMALASIPYQVNIPYAVLETNHHKITDFAEKPTYTYYSNSGIYLMRFELKRFIGKGSFYNATDMMKQVLSDKEFALIHYPLLDYWLDIGRPVDFFKAQEDIKHINML
jgi:dTDP-glucose pyrophosphorylase